MEGKRKKGKETESKVATLTYMYSYMHVSMASDKEGKTITVVCQVQQYLRLELALSMHTHTHSRYKIATPVHWYIHVHTSPYSTVRSNIFKVFDTVKIHTHRETEEKRLCMLRTNSSLSSYIQCRPFLQHLQVPGRV